MRQGRRPRRPGWSCGVWLPALVWLPSVKDPCGIGETGLDYYRRRSPREKQKEALKRQLSLARELKKPIIPWPVTCQDRLHDREAHNDLLTMVEEHGEGLMGVFHCFSGDLPKGSLWEAMAEKCLPYRIPWEEMGFYISIAGPVTYRGAYRLRELARTLSLERLLLETDSPFLSPYGGRNEPANVRAVAQKIAQAKGVSWEEIGRTTTENAALLFGL